jgi:ATP-dependent DNA helicase DinG
MTRQVPPELQSRIRETYKALLAKTGGVTRRGQQEMIGMIARAAANAKKSGEPVCAAQFAVSQAGTGSGKTFAYSLGCVPIALANDLKVIISVSTVALQEQLVSRDLVALASVMPEMKVALVKGRGRLACPARMIKLASAGTKGSDVAVTLLKQMESGQWSGDVDTLSQKPCGEVWAQMSNDRLGCTGRKCTQYAACPYYKNRAATDAANVVVVNHSLLLADLAAGNVILPKFENSILIVDEAHHLPEQALSSLSGGHALGDALDWVQQAGSVMSNIIRRDRGGLCAQLASKVARSLDLMSGALHEAQMSIESMGKTTGTRDQNRPVRFTAGELPKWLADASVTCCKSAESSRELMAELLESLRGDGGEVLSTSVAEQFISDVGRAQGRMERILGVWRLMTTSSIDETPVAKWIELEDGDLRVCASPLGVGLYLYESLWLKVAASIHVSATIYTVGGFSPYLQESGLARVGDVPTLGVQSPFDYANQACLIVPKNAADAKNSVVHTQYLIESIPQNIASLVKDGEGALILFSSWAQLREVSAAMPDWVKGRMLSQENMGRSEILSQHAAAIQNGLSSYVFGVASFEEGIDLRGKACVLVFIAKIPFSVPTDPVSMTQKEHLESQGRSHFDEIVMPHACRRLAQGMGRLIRSETDRGHIVLADGRLTNTRYGRAILATLPAYQLRSTISA